MFMPYKFAQLKKFNKITTVKILDVGSGNNAAIEAKKYYKNSEYHGIDINADNFENLSAMDKFYEIDLTKLQFDNIPDNYFDIMIFSHVIEHLHNGDKVILKMLTKLKLGGIIYIEYPGIKSTKLPSMEGTLNFYDDSTHCRIFSIKELIDLLIGFKIVKSGTRRSIRDIIFTPYYVIRSKKTYGKVQGNCFWDLLGFAEVLIAIKI